MGSGAGKPFPRLFSPLPIGRREHIRVLDEILDGVRSYRPKSE
jgi:hypothetical protein